MASLSSGARKITRLTSASTNNTSRHAVQYKSLASYLKYLEGEELTVELKNGKQCRGVLSHAEEPSMNLTLVNPNSNNDSNDNPPKTKLTHIRGAAIRYIHFGDDFIECIKAAQDREQSALQKYRRGIRKSKESS